MPEFTSIAFEVSIAGAWTSITSDVKTNPSPKWNVSIMSNEPLAFLGDPEYLTFTLDNSESSTGGIGYYTPGHANCMAGWTTGLQVRLTFTYDGVSKVKYFGWILPDGIVPKPGIYAERTVEVTCIGWMGKAAEHNLNLLDMAENVTIGEGVALILANMQQQPYAVRYGSGVSVFPTLFDRMTPDTKATAELDKLSRSELGQIYTISDGTLVVEGRNDRASMTNAVVPKLSAESGFLLLETGDYFLLEDGSKLILDETQAVLFDNVMMEGAETAYGKNTATRIKSKAYPRRVDAAATTVLWTLERATSLAAGETLTTLRARYRDPSGGATYITAVPSTVTGTYQANAAEDGSGADATASLSVTAVPGTAETWFSVITNTGGSTIWFGGDASTFQLVGKGIYTLDAVENVIKDDLRYESNPKDLDIDMPYQSDANVSSLFAEFQLNMRKDPKMTFEKVPLLANRNSMSMNAFMYLEPGMRAEFVEDMSAQSGDYFIQGYEAELISGKYVKWYPVLAGAEEFDFPDFENGYTTVTETFPNVDPLYLTLTRDQIGGGVGAPVDPPITGHATVWRVDSDDVNTSNVSFTADDAYTISMGALDVICDFSPVATGGGIHIGCTAFPNYYAVIYITTSLELKGRCRTVGIGTTDTGTTYTLTAGVWYRCKMHINQTGTLITFYLYSEEGALLWSDTISSGIPPAAVSMYVQVITEYASPSGVVTYLYLDYFEAGYKHD